MSWSTQKTLNKIPDFFGKKKIEEIKEFRTISDPKFQYWETNPSLFLALMRNSKNRIFGTNPFLVFSLMKNSKNPIPGDKSLPNFFPNEEPQKNPILGDRSLLFAPVRNPTEKTFGQGLVWKKPNKSPKFHKKIVIQELLTSRKL